jgi:cation transport ATPase
MDHSTVRFSVQGMTCANCARSVERKLAATPGVGNRPAGGRHDLRRVRPLH